MQLLSSSVDQNIWPTPKIESWKYFDFAKLKNFQALNLLKTETVPVIVTNNLKSTITVSPHQIIISEDLIQKGLKYDFAEEVKALNPETSLDHRFLKVNQNFKNLRLFFKDIKSTEMIYIIYDNTETNEGVYASSLQIHLENSELVIYENIRSEFINSKSFGSLLGQMVLNKSKLKHFLVQESLSADQALMYNGEAQLGEDSNYELLVASLNCQFVRNQNNIHINNSKSRANVSAFTLAAQKSYSETRTEIAHYHEGVESRQLFKAIVADEAKAIFNGRIFIDAIAQKTDSAQSCKGLLLGKKAQINAKPELEIYADDVKAAHGAAIGQVSQDEVFYLLSRGIPPKKVFELLAQAFAGEVLQVVHDKDLRRQLEEKISVACAPIFQDLVGVFQKTSSSIKES